MSVAKAAPMIKEISFEVVGGTVSRESGWKCCENPQGSPCDQLPVEYVKWSGEIGAEVSVTLNIPGWSWLYDAKMDTPIIFYAVFEFNLGPVVTVNPSANVTISGTESECGTCVEFGISGQVGVTIGFEGKVKALVQVFEEGHWYTIDTEVEFSASASASSSISIGGTYQVGDDCSNPGVSGVTVSYGNLTGTGQATATICGKGVSISKTWTLLDGYTYPSS